MYLHGYASTKVLLNMPMIGTLYKKAIHSDIIERKLQLCGGWLWL